MPAASASLTRPPLTSTKPGWTAVTLAGAAGAGGCFPAACSSCIFLRCSGVITEREEAVPPTASAPRSRFGAGAGVCEWAAVHDTSDSAAMSIDSLALMMRLLETLRMVDAASAPRAKHERIVVRKPWGSPCFSRHGCARCGIRAMPNLRGLHAGRLCGPAAPDAADSAHVLGHLGIADVLDVAGPGNARAQRLLSVDDDVPDAADVHRRVVGDQPVRVIRAGAGDRHILLLD